MESIAKTLAAGKLQPPRVKELPDLVHASPKDVQSALKLLLQAGRAVRVNDELYFDRGEMDRLRAALLAYLHAHGEIDAQKSVTARPACRRSFNADWTSFCVE